MISFYAITPQNTLNQDGIQRRFGIGPLSRGCVERLRRGICGVLSLYCHVRPPTYLGIVQIMGTKPSKILRIRRS